MPIHFSTQKDILFELNQSFLPRNQFIATVEQLAKDGYYRSALDMLLPVLEQNPDHPHLNLLAASIVFVAASFDNAPEAFEPLTEEYFYDRRLDRIFCQCAQCQSTWAPMPTMYYMKALLSITEGTNYYGGMFCPKCKKYFCADCINEKMPLVEDGIMSCPICKSHLVTPKNPNGRISLQTERRHQQQNVLTVMLREGLIPPSGEYVTELLKKISPDILLEQSRIAALPLFPWESKRKIIKKILEYELIRKMNIKQNMLDYYEYKIDDVRLCIVKIYQSRTISRFANNISCVYCGTHNIADSWPTHGDSVPFYFQTEEDTERTPGEYRISILCQRCGKVWYVYLTRSQIALFQRVESARLTKNPDRICELSWFRSSTLKWLL